VAHVDGEFGCQDGTRSREVRVAVHDVTMRCMEAQLNAHKKPPPRSTPLNVTVEAWGRHRKHPSFSAIITKSSSQVFLVTVCLNRQVLPNYRMTFKERK
jgi:hypothetical protein